MELYLLKSAACLALFFAFYKLFLENTSIHDFKRFYLSGSILASFLIPLITFTTYVEASPIVQISSEAAPQIIFTQAEQSINYWPFVLWAIYGLGVLFFSVKFFRNLFSLIQKIRKNPKYKNTSFINILLNEKVIPHTFFSYIFLNKTQFENHEIPSEVMLHEETHARQKHSLDVITVELLQIVFWFNPLFYFIKRSIKLNHEFLADRAVLKAGAQTSNYQKILLAFSSNAYTPSLAHSINYSSIKKRFTVMKTHTSKRAIWVRSILLLPLLSVLIYGFSTKEIVEREFSKKEISSKIIQQKATEAELAEYNKLAIKYNAVDIEKRIIKKNDLERLEINYKKMTNAQKANAQPFPEYSKMTARNIDIYILENGTYSINGLIATKKSFVNIAENFNQDISPEVRNKILNIHVQSNKDIPNEEIIFINDALQEYGFYRLVAPTQEVVRGKGNTPMKNSYTEKATEAELAEYNTLAKKHNVVDIEKRIIKKNDLERLEIIYKKMTDAQKANAQPFPECIPPSPPSPKVKKGEKSDIPPPPPAPKAPSAENGNLYTAAQAPPPPNSNPVEYVKELAKRGATFYIGPHKYSAEEAIIMVQKSEEATIDVSQYPKVIIGGC